MEDVGVGGWVGGAVRCVVVKAGVWRSALVTLETSSPPFCTPSATALLHALSYCP